MATAAGASTVDVRVSGCSGGTATSAGRFGCAGTAGHKHIHQGERAEEGADQNSGATYDRSDAHCESPGCVGRQYTHRKPRGGGFLQRRLLAAVVLAGDAGLFEVEFALDAAARFVGDFALLQACR